MFLTAAMFAVGGVNAQTEETLQVKFDNTGWSETTGCVRVIGEINENVQLYLAGQYQAFNIVDDNNAFSPSGYKGLKVQYELDPTNTSPINIHINVGKKSDGTGNDWDGMYQPLVKDQTEISFDFSVDVKALEKIKRIVVQQAEAGFANVLIKKIYLIKDDGSEVQLAPFAATGDGLPKLFESAVLNYRCQYSNVQIVDSEGNPLTYDPTSNTKQIYTIEFAEIPTLSLKLMPNKDEKDQWGGYVPISYNFDVTNSPQVFTFDKLNITAPMIELRLSNFTDGTGNVTVKSVKRGIIYPTSTATPNSKNTACWGTYSNNLANVVLSGEGVEVYNVTIVDSKLKFTQRANNKVAKGEGVIVKCNGGSFNVAVINDEVPIATGNLLMATPTTVQKITSTEGKLYYLTKDDNHKLGFYWGAADGTSLPNAQPGKAYLAIPNTYHLSKTRSIDIDDPETTDIEGVKAERVQHDAIYNLAGQRVGKLSKGINIVGNKKVLVK